MESKSTKVYFCDHCDRTLGKTAFFRHKRLYYDQNSKQWSKETSARTHRSAASLIHSCRDSRSSLHASTNTTSSDNSTDLSHTNNEDDPVNGMAYHDDMGVDHDFVGSESSSGSDHEEDNDGNEDDTVIINNEEGSESMDALFLQSTPSSGPNHAALPVVSSKEQQLVTMYAHFLLFFQTVYRISDRSVTVILAFFKLFLCVLSKVLFVPTLEKFTTILPATIYSTTKLTPNGNTAVRLFACCPSCNALYDTKSSPSKTCTFVRFPHHPQVHHRKSCEAKILRHARLSNGKVTFHPTLVYCYRSIIDSLQKLLHRPNFIDKCEAWRNANREPDGHMYNDVYDGKIWQEFQSVDGYPFLSLPYNFALHLNIDWFQPYKHIQHSEGVIYLAILNLPRHERFLQKNIILVGVIPGPKEPKKHVNTYLAPLAEELLQLWKGVTMIDNQGSNVLIRAALLCCGCDIPAAKKCCGFVGCNALHGCSRCLVKFPTAAFVEQPNYANLNMHDWTPRTKDQCREIGRQHRDADTKSKQKQLEREYGIRYSILQELPYFDPARMCIVDPMHNLFLGTTKHMLEIWKVNGIMTSCNFEKINEKVNHFVTPADIGRLPKNINTFLGFTAEQYKNWTLYYSLVCLKDILPNNHYNCWKLFVKACFMLCKRSISSQQLNEGNTFLLQFLESFVRLYGAQKFTPNMHLHGHLKDCIRDYGPVYSFWLFAFERLNGVLGSYNTNSHHISIQAYETFF